MKKGFTLLELVIVVIIVAVLAGLGIPQFVKTVERARAAEAVGTLGALRSAQLRYYAEYSAYTSVCTNLDANYPASLKYFNNPACATTGNIVTMVKSSGTIYTMGITAAGTLGCTGTGCPPM